MKCTAILAVSAAYLAASAAAATATTASDATTTSTGLERASSNPVYDQPVVQGCFSSAGDLVFNSTQQYNSQGLCGGTICQAMGYWVAATTKGNQCYCGNSYPPEDTLANDTDCNTPCTGYDQDACGGVGFWTVYNTGIELYDVPYANDTSSTSSSSSSTSTTSSSASDGQTVFVTATGDSSAETTSSSSSKGTNTAGIAAGVVAGVAVAAIGVGAAIFFMRRRRNREIEDEHRRNAAANSFFGKSNSSGGFSNGDTRLDPVMVQRRLSDGSIADNQDYSRKILRVTNA